METTLQSKQYLWNCLLKWLLNSGFSCPSCGCSRAVVTDRKYLITSLRRCEGCSLLFRTPTTTSKESFAFYQTQYEEGATTDLPSRTELDRLVSCNFRDLDTSYDRYISAIQSLLPGEKCRVLDYGCSWGYGCRQLSNAGFEVDGCEVSLQRANYARESLGVNIISVDNIPEATYDIFLSCHVIEHVPSVQALIDSGMRALRSGGLFVAFTPNGSKSRRLIDPRGWHRSWGCVHPQLIDDVYIKNLANSYRLVLGATDPYPLGDLRATCGSSNLFDMTGWELMLVIGKN